MSAEQLTIFEATQAGAVAAERVATKAAERDPLFASKAEAAIVRHLRASAGRRASGEELVDVARAHGCVPHDDRAFGAVFKSMARRGLIRTVGFALRRKGHGTAGGRVWGLCQ